MLWRSSPDFSAKLKAVSGEFVGYSLQADLPSHQLGFCRIARPNRQYPPYMTRSGGFRSLLADHNTMTAIANRNLFIISSAEILRNTIATPEGQYGGACQLGIGTCNLKASPGIANKNSAILYSE